MTQFSRFLSTLIELIKKIPDEQIALSRQIAHQTILRYIKQQNLIDYHYDKEKLEKLTTSAAVAQQVQQDIAKIKQQKLQATNFFSKQQTQEEKK